jgi:hypothetical protein
MNGRSAGMLTGMTIAFDGELKLVEKQGSLISKRTQF